MKFWDFLENIAYFLFGLSIFLAALILMLYGAFPFLFA